MPKDHEPKSQFFDEDVIRKAISRRRGQGRLPSLNPPGKFHRSRIYMGETYSDESGGANALTQGLALWLKADAITGLADNDPIATWPDSSGNGHDMTQPTGGIQPIFRTNIINGLPVARFDGAGDRMAANYAANLAPDANQTWFAVFRTDIVADEQILVWQGNASGSGFGPESEIHMGINDPTAVGNEASAYLGRMNPSTGSILAFSDTTNFHIMTAKFTNLLSTSPQAQVFIDGVAGTLVTGSLAEQQSWNGTTRLGAPQDHAVVQNYFDGDLAELLVYSTDKSSQRTQIEDYLRNKYGL